MVKKTLLTASLTGWLGMIVMRAMTRYATRQQPKVPKVQMHTWEGEGGNLPPHQVSAKV